MTRPTSQARATRIRVSARSGISLSLPAHAGDARDRGDAVVEAGILAHALALKLVGPPRQDRLAAERSAVEADADAGQLGGADHRLGLGAEPVDERLPLAERTGADPAPGERDGEAEPQFGDRGAAL